MNSAVFVVTKPLQLMVALSIIHQLKISHASHVIVANSFAGACSVADRVPFLEGALSGISVELAASPKEAYRVLRRKHFRSIYIDSDVGARKYRDLLLIRLASPRSTINVYEEGLGTYRTDLYPTVKGMALRLAGIGTHFGGCAFTSSLYLYKPEEYHRRFYRRTPKLHRIRQSLSAFIGALMPSISFIFSYIPPAEIAAANCNIYLSSWSIDEEFLARLAQRPGDNYVKPHPHIKNFVARSNLNIVHASVPAELLLLDLLARYEQITVYHHGSSVVRYVTSDRLTYVDIS